MKKTLLSVSLAIGLLFTGVSGASAATTVHYKDVKPGDNYYKAVENLLDQKAISRTLANFKPNDQVKRGQAASIIAKVLKLDIEIVKDPGFTDVPKTHQFYKYIAALANEGIIGGKGDGTFGVNQPLTRGQMSSILVDGFDIPLIGIHAVGHDGFHDTVNYVGGPGENSVTAGDIHGSFSGQFGQSIETMNYYDYISGYTSTTSWGKKITEFKQGNPIKRSQLALMINNIQNGTDYDYLYFKDFNIINNSTSNYTKYVTDEVKILDPSIIELVDVSNKLNQGLLDGGDEKIVIQNDYAILKLKKTGTTTISFENNEKLVEVTVTDVDGELKASFK